MRGRRLASGDMPELVVEPFQRSFGVAALERHRVCNVEAATFNILIDRIGVRISYSPKERIFHENDPAESIYKVVSGVVRTTKFLSDGRRQIGGFYLSGDYFGFECSGAHTLSAEAVTNAKIRIIKKSALAAVGKRGAIERQLLSLTTRELARLQSGLYSSSGLRRSASASLS